jgi:hypothetical protein
MPFGIKRRVVHERMGHWTRISAKGRSTGSPDAVTLAHLEGLEFGMLQDLPTKSAEPPISVESKSTSVATNHARSCGQIMLGLWKLGHSGVTVVSSSHSS